MFVFQKAIILAPWPRPDMWEYACLNVDEHSGAQFSVAEYLKFKKTLLMEGTGLHSGPISFKCRC